MGEQLTNPVQVKLKRKYIQVLHGHYKSGHNMQGGKKRNKTGRQPVLPGIRTMVVLATGKTRMEWR